jgi:hypothetical protein
MYKNVVEGRKSGFRMLVWGYSSLGSQNFSQHHTSSSPCNSHRITIKTTPLIDYFCYIIHNTRLMSGMFRRLLLPGVHPFSYNPGWSARQSIIKRRAVRALKAISSPAAETEPSRHPP